MVGKKEFLPVNCPFCGKVIAGGIIPEDHCPDIDCEMNKKGLKIPPNFYARVSFSAGVHLHNLLREQYGLGCILKIRNVFFPKEVEIAARATQVATMQGTATKVRLGQEAEGLRNLIELTKVDPTAAFITTKAAEVFSEAGVNLVALLTGKKVEKKRKRGSIREEIEEEEEEE